MTDTHGRSTGLLVVDVQKDVIGESINGEQTVGNVAELVRKARAAGIPVVWVRHHDQGLVQGSDGWQIVDELKPAEGEPIVEKAYGDSFADTDLADRLREKGIDSLVLCGAQSDACIRSTFYGGVYRGYPMTLVTDAHTTADMREWGASFSAEQAIEMINLQAESTRLPDVATAVTTTAEAFG